MTCFILLEGENARLVMLILIAQVVSSTSRFCRQEHLKTILEAFVNLHIKKNLIGFIVSSRFAYSKCVLC